MPTWIPSLERPTIEDSLRALVLSLVGCSIVLALVWAFIGVDFEPIITASVLAAGVIQFVIEPRLAVREARRGVLKELWHSALEGLAILEDPVYKTADGHYRVYPRPPRSTLETALTQGLFAKPADRRLYRALHRVRQAYADLDRRLAITETATAGPLVGISRQQYQERLVGSREVRQARSASVDLVRALTEYREARTGWMVPERLSGLVKRRIEERRAEGAGQVPEEADEE